MIPYQQNKLALIGILEIKNLVDPNDRSSSSTRNFRLNIKELGEWSVDPQVKIRKDAL